MSQATYFQFVFFLYLNRTFVNRQFLKNKVPILFLALKCAMRFNSLNPYATKFGRNREQRRNLKKFGVRFLDSIIIVNNDDNSAEIIRDYFFTFNGLLNSV